MTASSKVDEFLITPGSNMGDHFASIMFRAKVSYRIEETGKEMSMLIKTTPIEEGLKKDMLDLDLFKTEIKMYSEVVPKMEKLLESVGEHIQMGPKLLYHSSDPYILVFEDLKERNFEMSLVPLDYETSRRIYNRLAKWHASTVYLEEEVRQIKFWMLVSHLHSANIQDKGRHFHRQRTILRQTDENISNVGSEFLLSRRSGRWLAGV
jgi:hypothetical protein